MKQLRPANFSQLLFAWVSAAKGSFIKYVRKSFRKTNNSKPLIRTHTFAYQGVRDISFSENFAYVLKVDCPQEKSNFKTTSNNYQITMFLFVCLFVCLKKVSLR